MGTQREALRDQFQHNQNIKWQAHREMAEPYITLFNSGNYPVAGPYTVVSLSTLKSMCNDAFGSNGLTKADADYLQSLLDKQGTEPPCVSYEASTSRVPDQLENEAGHEAPAPKTLS